MLTLILVAGNETTTTLIGNAVLELLAHPTEETRLRADLSLLPSAIDEVLRFASPVQFDPRRAARDVELCGETVRKDEVVLGWLGSNLARLEAEVALRALVRLASRQWPVRRRRGPGSGRHSDPGCLHARS